VKRALYEGEAAESNAVSFSYDVGRKWGARQAIARMNDRQTIQIGVEIHGLMFHYRVVNFRAWSIEPAWGEVGCAVT